MLSRAPVFLVPERRPPSTPRMRLGFRFLILLDCFVANKLNKVGILHNELLEKHPDILQTLYQSYYFDRRGEFSKGEFPVSSAPVFSWNGGELTIRYLHYYILVGHQRAGRPLTSNQEETLNTVEALIQQPRLRIESRLQPGQILWTNNHWILHNRTAFEDSPIPEKRSHYTRLWLSR